MTLALWLWRIGGGLVVVLVVSLAVLVLVAWLSRRRDRRRDRRQQPETTLHTIMSDQTMPLHLPRFRGRHRRGQSSAVLPCSRPVRRQFPSVYVKGGKR